MSMSYKRLCEIHRGIGPFIKSVSAMRYLDSAEFVYDDGEQNMPAAYVDVTHNGFTQETIFKDSDLTEAIDFCKKTDRLDLAETMEKIRAEMLADLQYVRQEIQLDLPFPDTALEF